MKEQALAIAKNNPDSRGAKNELREYLQHVILRKMFELNMNRELVFHGGTALRIIHGLERFSEDLDFHILKPETPFDLESHVKKIVHELKLNGYSITKKVTTKKTVQTAFIKFPGLLFEANLSPLANENISIKIDIDTKPPTGFKTAKVTVNKYFPFSIIHHDKESFLSGKCAAIIQRKYIKGRDYFDLLFYLSRWKNIEPNFVYLNNCIKQTGYTDTEYTTINWKSLLLKTLENVDWVTIQKDVQPFIKSRPDMELLRLETFESLLSP